MRVTLTHKRSFTPLKRVLLVAMVSLLFWSDLHPLVFAVRISGMTLLGRSQELVANRGRKLLIIDTREYGIISRERLVGIRPFNFRLTHFRIKELILALFLMARRSDMPPDSRRTGINRNYRASEPANHTAAVLTGALGLSNTYLQFYQCFYGQFSILPSQQ